jgi:Tc toxin complex TcA C-terminal TcB-binding domain/Neuraminidase-like domain
MKELNEDDFKVYGIVYDEWIEPMKGAPVMVFDKDIRSEHLMGEGETDDKGNYSISYSKHKLSRPDKGGADLVVRLYGHDGSPLYASPVNFNAPAALQVDIDLGPRAYMGLSEFVSAEKEIRPFIGELSIADLYENNKVHDLSYLLSKTGISVRILLKLVAAFHFEKWSRLSPGLPSGVPAEVFYGLLSQLNGVKSMTAGTKLPPDLGTALTRLYSTLCNNTVAAMMTALQQAAIKNTITYRIMADKEKIQAELQQLKNTPATGGTTTIPILNTQIALAGLTTAQQQVVQENYNPARLNTTFWNTLAADPTFTGTAGQTAINKLQVVFQLSAWTSNNIELAGYIMTQKKLGAPADLSSLASLDVSDWVAIINASGSVPATGVNPSATVQIIAANIVEGVESQYPTQVLADRFTRATTLMPDTRNYLIGVLNAADFNINTTQVRSYLTAYVAKNQLPEGMYLAEITYQLLGMQRMSKVAQNADNAIIMLSANLQSARQIYAMGQTNFINQFGAQLGGTATATKTFNLAALLHGGAAWLTGSLITGLNNRPGNVLPAYGQSLPTSSFAANYPDLANLFGVGSSYCTCSDCKSFLSIPAYLTDLLDFLSQRKTTDGSSDARAVLMANDYFVGTQKSRRRPDIGDIDLNCKNTDIELPYIDVVNELMEDYIIPPIEAFLLTFESKKQLGSYVDAILSWLDSCLVPGTITTGLYDLLLKPDSGGRTPICNISLLSKNATVSDPFFSDINNGPEWNKNPVAPQWIIRDQFITLKLTLVTDGNDRLFPQLSKIFNNYEIDVDISLDISKFPVGQLNAYDGIETLYKQGKLKLTGKEILFVVEEIHETHLSAAEISTNPEYTNTNVYGCLSDPLNLQGNNTWQLYPDRIPLGLPFDLYFTEANMYLEKMGKQRYDLLNTYRQNATLIATSSTPLLGGESQSIFLIAKAYFDLSEGEAGIIFTADDPDQLKFWGPTLYAQNQEVDIFLSATGLTFTQLQTLLTLQFINPAGDSVIAESTTSTSTLANICNTANMYLTNVTATKLDHINRYLRLWNKLNTLTTLSMNELDSCIMCPSIGNGSLDENFAVGMYYFMQLMNSLSLTATQLLVFYQDMGTTGKNSLYQQLFQNRQVTNPLVAALQLPLAGLITDTVDNAGVIPVILNVCGIAQNDLTAILALDGGIYADLSVTNLSFIYACGLLSGALSCSVSDLFTFAGLTGINPLRQALQGVAANPNATYYFITAYNKVQTAGLSVDAMNYLLCNQSHATPSLLPNNSAVINGLTAFRTAIQTAMAASTPAPDPMGVMLKKWLADPDLDWDPGIAARLLAILGTAGTPNYIPQVQNNLRLLQLLQTQYGVSAADAYLPAFPTLSFTANPAYGTIADFSYDTSDTFLFYYGTMSSSLNTYLAAFGAATGGASANTTFINAVTALYQQSQYCPLSAVPFTGTLPAGLSANTDPAFSVGTGAIGFGGKMPAQICSYLLAQSSDPGYSAAVSQLFLASQLYTGPTPVYVQLLSLPAIALPGANAASLTFTPAATAYDTAVLSYDGAISPADCRALLGISSDAGFRAAVCRLFTTAQSGQLTSIAVPAPSAALSSLPTSDISTLSGMSFVAGQLVYTGQMTVTQQTQLVALAPANTVYTNAVNILYGLSQAASNVTTPLSVLPTGFIWSAVTTGLSFIPPALCFSGQMSTPVQNALLNLSGNAAWTAAVNQLFTVTQSTVSTAATAALPADGSITAASFPLWGVTYTAAAGATPALLGYTGVMSSYILDQLLALDADTGWAAAVTALYQATQAGLVTAVTFPLPAAVTQAGITALNPGLSCSAPDANGNTTIAYTGQLSFTLKQSLLALSPDAVYAAAIQYLYSQVSAILPFALPPINIPLPDTNLSNTAYAPGYILFTGTPAADSMDPFNLVQLGTDPAYVDAIELIYDPATPAGVAGVSLAALPAIILPSNINISFSNGTLSFTGQMTTVQYQTLQSLSTDPGYQAALLSLIVSIPAITASQLQYYGLGVATSGPGTYILSYTGSMSTATQNNLLALSTDTTYQSNINNLYELSQGQTGTVQIPATTLPAAVGMAALQTLGVESQSWLLGSAAGFVLYYNGQMSSATLTSLLSLSTNATFRSAMYSLYNQSQNTVVASTPLAALPPISIPPGLDMTYSTEYNILYYTGTLPVPTGTITALKALSASFDYTAAVTTLSQINSNPGSYLIYAPPPQIPFATDGITLSSGTIGYPGGTLGFTGIMSFEDYLALLSLSSDETYQNAVSYLFVNAAATAVSTPNYFALPAVQIPAMYAEQLSYASSAGTLVLAGFISAADLSCLLSVSSDDAYTQAVNTLYNAVTAADVTAVNSFPSLYESLLPLQNGILTSPSAADVYSWFLDNISTVYQPVKLFDAIAAQLAASFSVTAAVAEVLTGGLGPLQNAATGKTLPDLFATLTADSFAANTGAINPDPQQSQQACWYMQLARISFLISQYNISSGDMAWLIDNGSNPLIGALSLGIYPSPAEPLPFGSWEVFNGLRAFQKSYSPVSIPDNADPGQNNSVSVYSIISAVLTIVNDLASSPVIPPNPGAVIDNIILLTGWDSGQLQYLLDMDLGVPPGPLNPLGLTDSGIPALGCITDLTDISILQRLSDCFAIAARLKITPSRCVGWVGSPVSQSTANDIKNALKAQYPDTTSWTSAIIPLMNTLRQNRRDAVLAYLLSNSVTNPYSWTATNATSFGVFPDAYGVYGNFLIDIEMASCQQTTRTIQAYCSIQLFVQRCLLGIETNIVANANATTGDPDWTQWNWMNTYESWYEARYTFLFPENQILPQTLPNQSYLYQNFQNDLTQGAVTTDIVTDAYSNYIVGLDSIARLQVKGMWYDDPSDTLHVIARTYGGSPQVYYYRTLNTLGVWSPWEEVSAHIEGDYIIPFVLNGRIFLYWPVFTQASEDDKSKQTQTASSSSGSTSSSAPPANKYWQIQLAYSEYLNGQWTGKKVSTDYIQSTPIVYSGSVAYPDTSAFIFFPSSPDNGNSWEIVPMQCVSNIEMDPNVSNGFYPLDSARRSYTSNYNITTPINYTFNGFNAFLLDPLRGYPSGTSGYWTYLGGVWLDSSFDGPQTFDGSTFVNALDTPVSGTTALSAGGSPPILANAANFSNLISFQNSFATDYIMEGEGYGFIPLYSALFPFFYQDNLTKPFYAEQWLWTGQDWLNYKGCENAFNSGSGGDYNAVVSYLDWIPNALYGPFFTFTTFYHPFAANFISIIASQKQGLPALLGRATQLTGDAYYEAHQSQFPEVPLNPIYSGGYTDFNFNTQYSPANWVYPYAAEQIDFASPYSAYSQYNWELFFHTVLMSAMQLSQNQQFEDADTWFKYIFNPSDTSGQPAPQKFWNTKPFFEMYSNGTPPSIDTLIYQYEQNPSTQNSFWTSVNNWLSDPNDPHMLAQYRITPYMYTAFMKYLDNLIAWANYNYTQYTMETVNIAIQLYMLAQEMLGPEPQAIPPLEKTPKYNYYQLAGLINSDDYLSDPIVEVENVLPPPPAQVGVPGSSQKVQMLSGLYFCIPQNEVLLGYWTNVQTKLTQINNCLNIEGQFQPLSPFPSIPGLNGADGSGISDFGGVIPYYRFSVMVQKAMDLTNEVKSLGNALLAALEKQDAEGLSLLHATQEIAVQQAVDKIKQLQITDAQFGLQNLLNYQTLLNYKISYYSGLLTAGPGGLIPLETQALSLNQTSLSLEQPVYNYTLLANIMKMIPDFHLGINGAFGSPLVAFALGGTELGGAAESYAQYLSYQSHFADKSAAIATVNAGYLRRAAEWQFQMTLAQDELTQVDTQIQQATNKIAIANQDEQNQQLLIQNAEDVQSFLQNKYTNQQLYSWMITQISNVYFQSYQLAYSIAKQAEICFRYELGITDTSYINYGYWDSLHKGLLSGEALISNIRQMEMDYLNLNIREYELTRQISLAQLDPIALLQLKSNGSCYVNIPEDLFDLDYPGHYFRRIKHVAITLPGVVGPYTPVCLKMTIMNNSVRIDNTAASAAAYARNTDSTGAPTNDSRFLDNVAAMQYIATSNGVNDSGLFEMNLHDDRYLPFERAGAISTWLLELPSTYAQFDPESITDLIIHFSYTSRDGGAAFQSVVQSSLQKRLSTSVSNSGMALMRGFSARRDFPTQWYQFLNPVGGVQQLIMDVTNRFPFFTQGPGLSIKISSVLVLADIPAAQGDAAGSAGSSFSSLYLSGKKLSNVLINFGPDPEFGSMLYSITSCKDSVGVWTISNGTSANPATTTIGSPDINDLYIIFNYSLINSNS